MIQRILLFFLSSILLLTSCKLDENVVIPEEKAKLRDFTFSFSIADAPKEGIGLISMETYGDTVLWLQRDLDDTLLCVSHDTAFLANNSNLSVSLLQPYRLIAKSPNTISRIRFNFQGQDGRLDTLRARYDFRYKQFLANCNVSKRKASVTYADSIVLDPVQCILRLSLVDSTGQYSLEDWLDLQSDEVGFGHRTTEVRICDTGRNPQVYDDYYWYVEANELYRSSSANRYISLQDPEGNDMAFGQFVQIGREEGAANYDQSYEGTSWGTSCYAAIPIVTDDNTQQLSLQVMVTGEVGTDAFVYYGQLEGNVSYSAGSYYVTAPVKCYSSAGSIPAKEYAKVYKIK